MARFNPCFLIPIIAIFFSGIQHCRGSTAQLVDQICSQVESYRFCQDVFLKHVYTPNEDIKGLTRVTLTQTLIYGSTTRVFVGRAKAAEKDKNKQNLYRICEVGYELLVGEFTEARFAFEKGDYRNMIFHEGKCARFVSDCELVIGHQVPMLSQQNMQNRVLIQMAYFASRLLVKEMQVKG